MHQYLKFFMNDADWFIGTLILGGSLLLMIIAILYMIIMDWRDKR